MNCSKCGFQNPNEARFCEGCGANTGTDSNFSASSNQSFNQPFSATQNTQKRVIAYKQGLNPALGILMILGGVIIIIGLVLMFIFLIGGAIGGAIAGGVGFLAIGMIGYPIKVARLPNEMISIDDKNLYGHDGLPLAFSHIQSIELKSNTILVFNTASNKPAAIKYIKDKEQVVQTIMSELQAYRARNQGNQFSNGNQVF